MSDNTMPERLWAQYNRDDDTSVEYNAWHTHDDKFTETEYIRADVAQAQLDAANARIAELEAAQAWVSVDERLPDVDEVLAYSKDEWGYDVWEIDSYSLMQRRWLNDATPTHWMPLPPPPVTP